MTEIYKQTAEYAREHGELDAYRASMQENRACKEAIEETISKNFDGWRLVKGVVQPIMERFGTERVMLVLANTVQVKDWDGRFSRSNREWASRFDIPGDPQKGGDHRFVFVVNSHPAILDGFIDMARRAEREVQRPSVINALKAPKPEHAKPELARKREEVR